MDSAADKEERKREYNRNGGKLSCFSFSNGGSDAQMQSRPI